MQAAPCQHLFSFRVGVAVSAEVSAGIVRPYVAGEITGTFRPGTFSFRRQKAASDGLFIIPDPHTAAAVGSIGGKLISFRAGFERHAVGLGGGSEGLPQGQPLLSCDFPRFRKIPPDLGEEIDKADDGSLRISL